MSTLQQQPFKRRTHICWETMYEGSFGAKSPEKDAGEWALSSLTDANEDSKIIQTKIHG